MGDTLANFHSVGKTPVLIDFCKYSGQLFLALIFTTRMSDFNKSDVGFLNSDVVFLQLGCRILTTRISDFHNSDVGFPQLGYRILTTQISDFHKSNVGFSKASLSYFQQLRWHL